MSDLNNISTTKELNFFELLYNIWKYKKIFIYILITLILLSILLQSFITKKSIIEIRLQSPDAIHSYIYPSSSVLNTIAVGGFVYSEPHTTFAKTHKFYLNFYGSFLEPNLLSKNKLEDFSKKYNSEYDYYDFIDQNNVTTSKISCENEVSCIFRIVLPDDNKNISFFNNYLNHIFNDAFDRFRKKAIQVEQNKFDAMYRDINRIDEILEKFTESYETSNNSISNLKLLKEIYKERSKIVKENLDYINNLKIPNLEEWIIDGPTKKNIKEKFFVISKFLLPLILSLIIYLLYILVKLSKQIKKS